ncbi:hypothetical protein CMU59_18445 [Elizabethkingia anophelis]|uniref:hypothetical protein n=1 Tax=Elizabethkingia anophelis TaxID=1117645 RepID=UPI002012DF7A|nr:hypothetical protein [Elizabethkingia anophelis]MCL1690177.1 hypothetical protein [Elizabethkingia anophelis]MDV3575755.1 hypothetical protein [Elizabethkingia anophelis]MDV3601518.1 hypothetical protein [Elizabethkingia anophelis]MDV3608577.1 hypothetical protein [Elizabethkingia anophelis]MDV3640623.1 hypothetical protein [Elizabethkingia anophelis]
MYPIQGTETKDQILNGRIGDVRGRYWGEDASATSAIQGLPLQNITAYSDGVAINKTTDNYGEVTMFKHNTKNFFFVGDGGFISFNGGTDAIICPFKYNTTTKSPLPKPYGNAGNGYTAQSKDAYNSIIFGNVMLWAATVAEFKGIKPWKYAN